METGPAARSDIQALRGLAVLWVLLHHVQIPGVQAGYLGVDIFFVVSGYLITGLIQREREAGRFSFTAFYWRRAKRLLPAAYTTLAATLLLAPWCLTALELRDLQAQAWGALAFVSNLVLWQQTGYFAGAAEHKPLLHFWSLSIEEQYYLLLPALLVLAGRWRLAAVALLTLASLVLCGLLAPRSPAAAFYLLPTRAWELGLGSLGALWPVASNRPWLQRAHWPALAVLLVVPAVPLGALHPGPSALAVCVATLLLLWRAHPGQGSAVRVLAGLGDISYSLYLVHWPVLALLHNGWIGAGPLPLAWRLGGLLLAVLLAVAQYRWVEAPLRRLPLGFSLRRLGVVLAASSLLALWPVLVWRAPATDFAPLRAPNYGLAPACDQYGSFAAQPVCRSGPQPRWLVWGDSYAMALVPGLAAVGPGLWQATHSSCGPFLNLAPYRPDRAPGETYSQAWAQRCKAFNDTVLAFLAREPGIDTVILSSKLRQYLDDGAAQRAWTPDGRPQPQPGNAAGLLAATEATVQALQALGKKVLIVAPPPASGFDIGACLERRATHRWSLGAPPDCRIPLADYQRTRAASLDYLARVQAAGLPLLRLDAQLCDATHCRVEDDGLPLYRDAFHLSIDGSQRLAERWDWAGEVGRRAR